jgi:alpha-beta hydrolase superfamily lysophospholipase
MTYDIYIYTHTPLHIHPYIQGELKGVVGFCHGYSEGSSTMQRELAMKFCERGFAVITYDAEGHGFSGTNPIYIKPVPNTVFLMYF